MTKKKRKIEEFNKRSWKKLDDIEKHELSLSGDWKQQGPYLINKSGKLDYAINIGMNKQLVGVDKEGQPVLKVVN